MIEKRVILVIVEGPSDEAAIGSIMKEYFSDLEVQFAVVHGDITLKDYTSVDNIVGKINSQLEIIRRKYRYHIRDFIKIIHLTDTDGVFAEEKDIRYGETASIQYYISHIETNDVRATIERNRKKAEIIFKLRKTGKVNGVPYKIYFNSCNLEHVLYNELKDFTDEEKQILSDEFAEKYEGKAEEFVEWISGKEIAVQGTYQKTWDFIEKGNHSLNRYSNMHLIFDKGAANNSN